MGNPLFAKKPISQLMEESRETGEHSLKRTLGPFQLTALGVGAVIGAGIFVLSGLGAHYAGTRADAVVRAVRNGMRLCGAVLCGIRRHDSAGRQRLHVRLRHAGRNIRVDHRVGPDARICHGREHGLFRMVEPLHRTPEYFSHQNAAVAGVRPLDGAAHGRKPGSAADGASWPTPVWCPERRRSWTK